MNGSMAKLQLGHACAGGLSTYTTTRVAPFPISISFGGRKGKPYFRGSRHAVIYSQTV